VVWENVGREAIAQRHDHPMRMHGLALARPRPRRTLNGAALLSSAQLGHVRSAHRHANALALRGANFLQPMPCGTGCACGRCATEMRKMGRQSDTKVPLCISDGSGHLARRRCCRGTFLRRGLAFGWCSAFFRRHAFPHHRRRHVTGDATCPSATVVCGARRTGFRTTIVALGRGYLECRATATTAERFGLPGAFIANRSARTSGFHRRSALASTIDPVCDRRDADEQ
jgi:hypothetical protein